MPSRSESRFLRRAVPGRVAPSESRRLSLIVRVAPSEYRRPPSESHRPSRAPGLRRTEAPSLQSCCRAVRVVLSESSTVTVLVSSYESRRPSLIVQVAPSESRRPSRAIRVAPFKSLRRSVVAIGAPSRRRAV
jgi:hypothetical protein